MSFRQELKSPTSGNTYIIENASDAARMVASGYRVVGGERQAPPTPEPAQAEAVAPEPAAPADAKPETGRKAPGGR